jgi:hypothetical protein
MAVFWECFPVLRFARAVALVFTAFPPCFWKRRFNTKAKAIMLTMPRAITTISRGPISPRPEMCLAHGCQVHIDDVTRQHGDGGGQQVVPEVDLGHAVEIVADAEGDGVHAEKADDLPAFLCDGVVEEMEALAFSQPCGRPPTPP